MVRLDLPTPGLDPSRNDLFVSILAFELWEAASQEFPPEISSSHIRASISKYEDEMSADSKTSVCCSCGQLVATTDIHRLNDNSNGYHRLSARLP